MRAVNNILDTIECSTMGWQDKPPKMPKAERLLDGGDPADAFVVFELGGQRHDGGGYIRNPIERAIIAVMQHMGADGSWVMREAIVTRTQGNEKTLTQAFARLIEQGKIERSHAKGARMCYRLARGSSPAKPGPYRDEKERMRKALGQDWVTAQGYAERFQQRADVVRRYADELVKEGWAERQRSAGLVRTASNAVEYRASAKLLLSRLNPR